jgi:DNA replication initiation complex subunit (GINS family)
LATSSAAIKNNNTEEKPAKASKVSLYIKSKPKRPPQTKAEIQRELQEAIRAFQEKGGKIKKITPEMAGQHIKDVNEGRIKIYRGYGS